MTKILVLGVVLCVVFTSCIFSLPTDAFIDGKTYVDPELGFEITAVAGWEPSINRVDSTRAVLLRTSYTEFQPTIRVAAGAQVGSKDLAAMLSAAVVQRKTALDSIDTNSIRKDTITVDTVTAGRLEFAYTQDRIRYRTSQVFIPNAAYTILVTFLDLDSIFGTRKPEFDRMLATIRVYGTDL